MKKMGLQEHIILDRSELRKWIIVMAADAADPILLWFELWHCCSCYFKPEVHSDNFFYPWAFILSKILVSLLTTYYCLKDENSRGWGGTKYCQGFLNVYKAEMQNCPLESWFFCCRNPEYLTLKYCQVFRLFFK